MNVPFVFSSFLVFFSIGFVRVVKINHSLKARFGDDVIEIEFTRETHAIRCHRLHGSSLKYESAAILNVPEEHASEFLQLCDSLKSYDHQLPRRQKRFLSIIKAIFMVPGTKWCGWGNTAKHNNDLGEYNVTDLCCRSHDQCPVKINGWTSDYGLTNYSPFSRSSCTCEEDFYQCLLEAAESEPETAAMTGSVYFNVLDFDCLSATRKKKCLEWGWFGNCRKYSKTATEDTYTFTDNKFTFPSIEHNMTDSKM